MNCRGWWRTQEWARPFLKKEAQEARHPHLQGLPWQPMKDCPRVLAPATIHGPRYRAGRGYVFGAVEHSAACAAGPSRGGAIRAGKIWPARTIEESRRGLLVPPARAGFIAGLDRLLGDPGLRAPAWRGRTAYAERNRDIPNNARRL